MRRRSRREPRFRQEPSKHSDEPDKGADVTTPVTWSVEDLNALGPMTGLNHRSFVPIVRSLRDSSPGDLPDASYPRTQL